jgi:chromosome segregation ATPase
VIEQVMVFALGFLAAGLIALAAAPAFWRRAIRLSTRRLEMQLPLSPDEILAGRDLLRAEFAVERRRLEQKAEALNHLHAADMAELGRRAAIIAAQDADLRALSKQDNERRAELAALKTALAKASAELAATTKEGYDTSGLIARKDAQINLLSASFEEAKTLAAKQRDVFTELEANMARQGQALAAQTDKIERLEGELSTLRLQHQADQVTLKTAAARVADREETLEAAVKREKDLIRHRMLQAETARAAEGGYLEKIERLRSAHATSQDALDAARKTCAGLTQELAELRATLPPHDIDAALLQREENEILRRKINEIGAAIIRAAGGGVEAAPEEAPAKGSLPEDTIPEKSRRDRAIGMPYLPSRSAGTPDDRYEPANFATSASEISKLA